MGCAHGVATTPANEAPKHASDHAAAHGGKPAACRPAMAMPERLPGLPAAPRELARIEQTALARRLDVQAVQRDADAAINTRSEARDSYLGYRAGLDLARRYRDEIIPLRKKIAEETLLRYNGMLASPFELLADAREQAQTVNSYIEALKDFWLADVALEGALGGRLDAPAQALGPTEPKEHPAHDGRQGPVRERRDGRDVHGAEGARGTGAGDHSDPGWYKHPAGTVAREWIGEAPAASGQPALKAQAGQAPASM